MKLFLDESVNTRLRHHFPDHDAHTAEYMGWKSFGNGELLSLARQEFDVFITRDQDIPDQQNITPDEIPIILLYPRSNSVSDLRELIPEIYTTLPRVQRGHVYPVYPPSQADQS